MSKVYNSELQARLEQFCGREGAGSQAKAAAAIGLSQSTLSQFRRGIYEGDIAEVENKLREHFAVMDARDQQPSNTSPYRLAGEYVPTSISEQIYKTIRYCQLEKGIMIAHGDAGIGKTKAAAKYVHDNSTTSVYVEVTPTTGTLNRFVRLLARELGISETRDRWELIELIKGKLLGTSKVLIIDEAQHLKHLTLEEIRNWTQPHPITGRQGIGIVLIGNSQIHSRMVGRNEDQFAQQFSRSRPHHYSATHIQKGDVEKMFPVLRDKSMDKELGFLLAISNSRWALRAAVNIWNDAVNGEDISYRNLKGIAQRMGIGVIA